MLPIFHTLLIATLALTSAAQPLNQDTLCDPPKPQHYGVLVFPTFELIDVVRHLPWHPPNQCTNPTQMGPLEVLTVLSRNHAPMKLSLISNTTLQPVTNDFSATGPSANNFTFGAYVLPQYTLSTAPDDIDVLLVPGGVGTRVPANETQRYVDFIAERYPALKYLVSVCTGAGLLARAGVLDGKKATTNKASWDTIVEMGPKVDWVRKARWTVDGNVWTTSGVSAGIDGTFALVESLYGKDVGDGIAKWMEYVRIQDPNEDPFA